MKNKKDKVWRISSPYVAKNCAQIFVPYGDSITMINRENIVFHYDKRSSFRVNNYLDDFMRSVFPYSNIPTH